MTTAAKVASKSFVSSTLAPAITAASGPPCSSANTIRFVPGLPRSVGFGPTSPRCALCHAHHPQPATFKIRLSCPRTVGSSPPADVQSRLALSNVETGDAPCCHHRIPTAVCSTDTPTAAEISIPSKSFASHRAVAPSHAAERHPTTPAR